MNLRDAIHTSVAELPRRRIQFRDHAMQTFDQQTVDSTGIFLVGELERLDPTMNMPLASVTWSRDIDLRTDVSLADEFSSFTLTQFAAPSGTPGSNKNFLGKQSTTLPGAQVDIGKTPFPLTPWGMELAFTIFELESAIKAGRPIDQQKLEVIQLKWQMDNDEQVYVGDTTLGLYGMLNTTLLTNTGNAVTGTWGTATAAQILADVNSILTSAYKAAGYAVIPNRLLVDPTSMGILISTIVSSAGNISVLEYLKRNNYSTAVHGVPLEILPCKWLLGTNNQNPLGVAATNSMFAYNKNRKYLRYPVVPLQRTPTQYRGVHHIANYYGKIGAVEMVYPDTCALRSNLG